MCGRLPVGKTPNLGRAVRIRVHHPHGDDPDRDVQRTRDPDETARSERRLRRYERGLDDGARDAPGQRPGPGRDRFRRPERDGEPPPQRADPEPRQPPRSPAPDARGRDARYARGPPTPERARRRDDRRGRGEPRNRQGRRTHEGAAETAGADPSSASERPDFDDETQERIYSYVARHGGAKPDAVRDDIDLGEEAFTYHLEVLRRQGYVEEDDDALYLTRAAAAGAERVPGAPEVVVRPARQSDLSGVVAVMREVTDERTYVVAESVAEQVAYEETVERHTSASSRTFFVATVDREADRAPEQSSAAGSEDEFDPRDAIVGWAHLTVPEVEKLSHTAELTVGVVGPYRRMGVGGALVERALEWAAADGRRRVYQSLPATNRVAIGFLEAHGWRVEAVRENHYEIGGSFVDEVMMAIEL